MTTILHRLLLLTPALLTPAAAMDQAGADDSVIAFCRPAPSGCLCSAEHVEDSFAPGDYLRHLMRRRQGGALSGAEWDRALVQATEACGTETIAALVQGVTEASLTPPRRP